jgi:hypothetical protein
MRPDCGDGRALEAGSGVPVQNEPSAQIVAPGRYSTWLSAAYTLGLAFLLWQILPLEEWLMCLALGSPLHDTPQRWGTLGALRGVTGLVVLPGSLAFVLASAAKEAREPRPGGARAAAAGLTAALVLTLGWLGWARSGAAALVVGPALCCLCAGMASGRLVGRHIWRSQLAELTGGAVGLLLGAFAEGVFSFGSGPPCLNYVYSEGLLPSCTALAALTIASFSVARAVQVWRAAVERRAARS